MAVRRLNHAVLYVRDVPRSVAFYTEALGFLVLTQSPGAAFLRASGSTNDHDLGLFGVGEGAAPHLAGPRAVGLYHLAWEVETLGELRDLRARLDAMGALVGQSDHSTTKSLYAKDPDDLEFEVCWIVPKDRLDETAAVGAAGVAPLDLDAELARYGAATVGGLGISWPD
jgi:catechol 2,3-dioxygenase-like lactoylglutathione lyase family enzyme